MSTNTNKFERHETRLATTDETGKRVYLYPEDIKGFWRTYRTYFYWFLIIIYLVIPWIHFNGNQVILLNIVKREFHFFGHTFYAHHAPYLIFILLAIPLFIGFLTTLFGRVWCGWACPQTVFIDAIYSKIERIIEGTARQREKLQNAPLSFNKIFKKGLKWLLFTLVSLHIAHSFVGYFVGTRELFWMSLSPPSENLTLFMITMGLSALFLFDFGWFREQFCIVACPYGRFQSVMMDENSLVVGYDAKRGEPRRGTSDTQQQDEGDCINCYHCVKACPTGIDIRRGTQLECIACTNCIDACDEIMDKVNRPHGLIRYMSENEMQGKPRSKWSLRSTIYLSICIALLGTFTYLISSRSEVDIVVLNLGQSPYTQELRNGVTEITNRRQLNFVSHATDLKDVRVELEESNTVELVMPRNPWPVRLGHNSTPFFLRFPKEYLSGGRGRVTLNVYNAQTNQLYKKVEVNLVGPYN